MPPIFRVLTTLFLSLVVFFAVAGLVGMALPRHHRAASTAVIHQSPDTVWAIVSDLSKRPAWRKGVRVARPMGTLHGHPLWEQSTSRGEWLVEVSEVKVPTRMVTVSADTSMGLGATWIVDVVPAPGGSRVTFTEDGFIANPVMRFFSNVVFGLRESQNGFLEDLGRHFGEAVHPKAA